MSSYITGFQYGVTYRIQARRISGNTPMSIRIYGDFSSLIQESPMAYANQNIDWTYTESVFDITRLRLVFHGPGENNVSMTIQVCDEPYPQTPITPEG